MKIQITLDSGHKITFKGKRINYHFDQGIFIIYFIDKYGALALSYPIMLDNIKELNIISKGGSDEKKS